MRLKKVGHKRYHGKLSGEDWWVIYSPTAKAWLVWRGPERERRYYRQRQQSLQFARAFIACIWLGEKLNVIDCRASMVGPEGSSARQELAGLLRAVRLGEHADAASVMAFVDFCTDHDLMGYVRPWILEGVRAGIHWPGPWRELIHTIHSLCKKARRS